MSVSGSYFNKVACLRLGTLLKKRRWHRYFPVNFLLRNCEKHFFTEHLWTTASVHAQVILKILPS